jgi:hypothetical protein
MTTSADAPDCFTEWDEISILPQMEVKKFDKIGLEIGEIKD